MKLKYYLRGMGIGIILTAIIMGFALGGHKRAMSDAEVIERAKDLGMTESSQGVLTQYSTQEISQDAKNDSSSSASTLDEEGKEVYKEVNQEVALSNNDVPEVAGSKKEGETSSQKNDNTKTDTTKSDNKDSKTKENSSSTDSSVNSSNSNQSDSSNTNASKSSTSDAANNNATDSNTNNSNNAASSATTNSVAENTAKTQTSYATTQDITVTIPGGLGSDAVAEILYKNGVVDSAYSFNRYLIDRGKDRIIRSGTKVFPAGSTYEDIANIITR